MPARSRRPVSLPENPPGRRLTSLKGGNRGRQPQGYRDLIVGSAAAAAKAGRYYGADSSCPVVCTVLRAVSRSPLERGSVPIDAIGNTVP